MTAAEKYDIKTAPVSDAEINFLAEIFREMMMNERKEQHECKTNDEAL